MTTPRRILHHLLQPVLKLLYQGLRPKELAIALALGMVLSCFPVFGATTTLCALAALAFRLNLPAVQAANYAAAPLQLLLILPFIRLGEVLFRTEALPLSLKDLRHRFETAPLATLHQLWTWEWHAIVAWAIVAIPATALLYAMLHFILKRVRLPQQPAEAQDGPTNL